MSREGGPASRIRVLPDHVANQIAAGEVVERPASVVKELMENALDAQAGMIQVSIWQGGKTRIRVADDGWGMARADVLACLDRHATSKIRRAEDLRDIRTLGFRGEALSSIAAVSRLVIDTAARGEETGTRLRVLGGRIQEVENVARQPGTTVDVKNLFLNTPVRARFLRSGSVETRSVSEVLHTLALANRRTRFVFDVNGSCVLELAADRSLPARIGEIWKGAGASGLIPVCAHQGDLRLVGAVQRPDQARPGFRRAHLFVNGRPFRDRGILAAGDRGYRTTLPEGTRAWLFLFLSVLPDAVDVNVHPSKTKVNFRGRREIEEFVEASVRQTLEGIDAAAVMGQPPSMGVVREHAVGGPPGGNQDREEGAPEDPREDESQIQLFGLEGGHPNNDHPNSSHGAYSVAETMARSGNHGGARSEEIFLPRAARPTLLQIHNSFILAETRDGMVIVDQHAAHERVLYERILARFESGESGGQRLLFPFTIRLTRQELDVVQSVPDLLARIGFQVEPFGTDALLVQAVPSPHPHFDAERCIREVIQELAHGSDLMRTARNQNERVAMSFACKGAIKAGQKLTADEMQELFDQLFATQLPYHDIHGRPTVVRLGLGELRRKFGRT